MANFRDFKVSRIGDEWAYRIELRDDAGGVLHVTATVEDLDVMVAALDEQLDEMVEAAARLAMDD